MHDKLEIHITTNQLPPYHTSQNPTVFKPRLLHPSHDVITGHYELENNSNPFFKKSINRMLCKKHSKSYINYKELLFDGKSDLLRRYYDKQDAIKRKVDLYKLYQFAIPKPKIYTKELVRLHFRYYYVKRKLREDTLREILHHLNDEELHKLDVNYLEKYVRERHFILNECSANKPSLLKEIGLNQESPSKKVSFGLSISRILGSIERKMEESMTFLKEELINTDIVDRTVDKQPLQKISTDTNTFKKDLNFKKSATKQNSNKKITLIKAKSGMTEKLTTRLHERIQEVKKESKSVYASSILSAKRQIKKPKEILMELKNSKNGGSRRSLKIVTRSNTDCSRSELTYSDTKHDYHNRQLVKRISIFKTLAPYCNKLTKQRTLQKVEPHIDKMISKLKMTRMNTEPIFSNDIEADRVGDQHHESHKIKLHRLADIDASHNNTIKKYNVKKGSYEHDIGDNTPRYEDNDFEKDMRKVLYTPKVIKLNK